MRYADHVFLAFQKDVIVVAIGESRAETSPLSVNQAFEAFFDAFILIIASSTAGKTQFLFLLLRRVSFSEY